MGKAKVLGISYFSIEMSLKKLQEAIDSSRKDWDSLYNIKSNATRANDTVNTAMTEVNKATIRMRDFHAALGKYVEKVKKFDEQFAADIAKIDDAVSNYTSTNSLTNLMKYMNINVFLQNGFPLIDGTFFGGNQAWFSNQIGRDGGCGTTAAANMLAYFALTDPAVAAALNVDVTTLLTKGGYTAFMERVYQVVTPSKTPLYGPLKSIFGDGIPITLGVWPIERWANMVTAFGNKNGLNIKVHSIATSNLGLDDLPFGKYIFDLPKPIAYDDGINFIREGLSKDRPVGLLNTFNPVMMTGISSGASSQNTQQHWVTITDMQYDTVTLDYKLTVSSWGSTYTISYKELHESWKTVSAADSGLAYLEVRVK